MKAGGNGGKKSPKSDSPRLPIVTRRGWRFIGAGAGVATAGYLLLFLADPAGKNWASAVSPAIIIAGYAIIGIGTVLPASRPRSSRQ
jgi:hypothetical protein